LLISTISINVTKSFLYSTKYYIIALYNNQYIIKSIDYYVEKHERISLSGIGYKKRLVYYSQSSNGKVRTTQIMTPYSLTTSAVSQSSGCQDISDYNPGITSPILKQVNLPALQAWLNYDQLTSIYKLLSNRSNSLVPPLVVSQEVNTKSL
jgi:hypothetical protein